MPYEKIGDNEPVCIADEVPFEIPESWEWCRLSDIFSVLNGDRGKNYPSKSALSATGIPFISALNLDGKTVVDDDNLLCMSEEQYNRLGNGKLVKDDVVICIRGSLGKHGRFPFEKGAIASSLVILRPHMDISIISNYIMMYLDTPLFFSEIKKYDNGTAQPNLAAKSLELFFVPVPPTDEQQRILDKVHYLENHIGTYECIYSKLDNLNNSFPDELKKSILQQAVMGKLVPQDENDEPASVLLEKIRSEKDALIKAGKLKKDKRESIIYRRDNSHYEKLDGMERCIDDEIPFEIPDSWSWCRIKDIFETSSGTTPSKSNSSYYDLPKYNWVRTTDLNNDVLTTCEIKISKKAFEECRLEVLPYDSVCIAMYGGAGTIGKNALIRFETTINQSVCAIHPNGFINMEYVQLYIKYLRPEWMRYASGSRKDPNINQVIIKNMLIPIPPINEQIRIVISAQRVMYSCEKI